jgi:hypothetical protein
MLTFVLVTCLSLPFPSSTKTPAPCDNPVVITRFTQSSKQGQSPLTMCRAAGRELGYKDETDSNYVGFKSSYSFKCLLVDPN